METFESLEAWKEARVLRNQMSVLCKKMPSEEKFRLIDQLYRASRSITANIAEGFGRFHHQENIQFCRQARGSLLEVLDHLTCSLDEKYITQTQFDEFREQIFKVKRILNGYIAYLKRAKESG